MIVRPSVVLVNPLDDLQAAIDAVSPNGGIVQLGPGTFTAAWRPASTNTGFSHGYQMWLQIPSGVTLRGQGPETVLVLPATTNNSVAYTGIVLDGAVDSGVENLQIQGSQSDGTHGSVIGIWVEGASLRAHVKNVLFAGVSGTTGCTSCCVTGGESALDLGYHVFEDCDITGCVGTESSRGLAFGLGTSSYSTIRNNRVTFYSASSGRHGVYLSGACTYCLVTGNAIANGSAQAIVVQKQEALPGNPSSTHNKVTNNIINGSSGIVISLNCLHNEVSGNSVFNSTADGIILTSNYPGLMCEYNVVSDNLIYHPQSNGVWLSSSCNNNVISGNTIVYPGRSLNSGISGILLQRGGITNPPANGNRLVGNVVVQDPDPANQTNVSILIDNAEPVAVNTSVIANVIDHGYGPYPANPALNGFLFNGGQATYMDANVFVGDTPVDSKVVYEDDYVMYEDAIVTY